MFAAEVDGSFEVDRVCHSVVGIMPTTLPKFRLGNIELTRQPDQSMHTSGCAQAFPRRGAVIWEGGEGGESIF